MDDTEKATLRSEILDDVGALLREQLAGDAWGRVLVEVVRGADDGGEPAVAGIDVEDIVGDEARVDAVFGDASARALLPVLAKATEALCEIEGVELEDVRGGTFVRQPAGDFAWLPGLVHMPSPGLEAEWDALVATLKAKHGAVEERFDLAGQDGYEVDLAEERIVFTRDGEPRVVAHVTLIATFSHVGRTWAWGGYNKNLPAPVRAASAALADALPDRDVWEVGTPVFPTDLATAWALAALVCDRAGGDTVHATPAEGGRGLAFLLLKGTRAA